MIRFKFSRRIGSGGMGDVFLALQEGIGGFEKFVVVKRIHPELTQDQSFVDMFLNEARLVAAVRHPNVVEILDIKRDANGLFIVLEYLSGETIHYITRSLAERRKTVPYPIACRLVADLAEGLHAAHTTTDNDGELLGLVHRDVTPSNLIVGYNGVPKILDFGVAAGAAQRVGGATAVVGKVGYQAPEQIAGLQENARTDVFQLAICLHEILCGEPLFATDDEHEAMLSLVERPIPTPSSRNPDLPEELDQIVMNALTLDWDERTSSAEELGNQLEALLEGKQDHVTQKRVAEWMRSTFDERYEERVQLERDIVSELRGEVVDPADLPAMFADVTSPGRRASPSAATRVAIPAHLARRRKNRRPVGAWIAACVLLTGAGAGALYHSSKGDQPASPARSAGMTTAAPSADATQRTVALPMPDAGGAKSIMLALRIEPSSAEIVLDGVLVGKGMYRGSIARDGTTHALRLSALGYKTRTIRFRDTAPPKLISLELDPHNPDDVKQVTSHPVVVRRTKKTAKANRTVKRASKTTVANKPPTVKPDPSTKQPATTKVRPQPKTTDPWQNEPKTDNKDPWKK